MSDARALPPDAAKAIIVARSAGVDLSGGGKGVLGNDGFGGTGMVFEVRRVSDGWYVYCHGARTPDGKTAHINSQWDVDGATYGPPPSASTASTGESQSN